MAEQNYKNHARIDPAYHYVLMPILLVNFVVTIVHFVHRLDASHGWSVVVALALLILAGRLRMYATRLQDRIILLEQRIRMAALLPLEMHPMQRELTTGQLIALRFASDAELASLTERAVREKLAPKAIKEQVQSWRPDINRV